MSVIDVSGGVSLRRLLPTSDFIGTEDVRVHSCCGDWHDCRPGDVFVARATDDHDGHDSFDLAIQQGAVAIVTERLMPTALPQIVVQDTREAFASICHALSGTPANSLDLIGITGSYGKTTTQLLLGSILESAGHVGGTLGSLGRNDGCGTNPVHEDFSQPPLLAKWLAETKANGCKIGLLEASSRALSQRHFSGLEFRAGVVTNIRREHVDVHGSSANYRRAKRRLLESLTDDGFAVMNADDPVCREWLNEFHCPVLTFGIENPAELTATIVERHRSEQTFLLEMGDDAMPVRTTIIGKQHIYNCLAAAATSLVLGIDPPDVVRGLEAVRSLPGRLQRIECGQDFSVFVDGSDSPESVGNALLTLQELTPRRLICVTACDSPMQAIQRSRLGRVVERFADLSIITTGGNFDEEPLEIAHQIIDGFDRPASAHVMPSRRNAIQYAIDQAEPGDIVLLCGNPSSRLLPFVQGDESDANVATSCLRQKSLALSEGMC